MKKIFAAVLFALLCQTISAQETLDKIVAVVDDEIILMSELDVQTSLYASQRKLDPSDEAIKKIVLNSMIEEKLLYAQAELDSITVSESQVDQQLDYQINYFIQQYGSRERVEEAYGMSIERIKRELRDDVKKNLMAETVRNQKFGTVEASRREVEEFFMNYKDSLGLIPEKFTLSHIFQNPQASEKVRKKAYNFALSLLDSIKNGADFEELAKKYSNDPGSAKFGGDLGFVKRGVFFPEFESVAFALKEGEYSGVVESPVGFHIIQLIERRGESIHARHILIKIKPDDEADIRAIDFLASLRDSIINGTNTFEYYAAKYSDDEETRKHGGALGVFEASQLDESMRNQVFKLKEGEISFPKRLDVDATVYGYHIVKLDKRTPEHKPTLETDFNEIKQLADFTKKQKLYLEWMKELKEKIYWKINL